METRDPKFETQSSIGIPASNPQLPASNILITGLLILTILLVVFVRLRLLNIPFERDEGEYAYAGQLMKQGIPPYSGVYNMKFPGAYFCYFLIEVLFGQTVRAIHFGAMLVNLLSAFFIYRLGKRLFSNTVATISTISFLLLSVVDAVEGVWANAEHFVLLFALPGILFLFTALEKRNSRKLFLSGIFLGLAVLMKQHGFAFVIFGTIWVFYDTFSDKEVDQGKFRLIMKQLFIFISGVICPFLITVVALALAGALDDFWWLTFQYAREYVSTNTWKDISDNFVFKYIFKENPLLWILCVAGIISAFFQRNKASTFFLIAFALFSFLSICPGFYFRPHYFILILPAASLLIGAVFHPITSSDSLTPKISYIITGALISLSVLSFIILNFSYLFLFTPPEISRRVYPKEHFNEMVEIAKHIKENTLPDDCVAVIGSEPEIYFYSQRRSASGYIYCYPLIEEQKYRRQMLNQYFSEIESALPKYVVLINTIQAWAVNIGNREEIFKWSDEFLKRHYMLSGAVYALDSQKPNYVWNNIPDSSWVNLQDRIEIYCRK